jgi:hypothetical protein
VSGKRGSPSPSLSLFFPVSSSSTSLRGRGTFLQAHRHQQSLGTRMPSKHASRCVVSSVQRYVDASTSTLCRLRAERWKQTLSDNYACSGYGEAASHGAPSWVTP